jgi:hypothetical protein
LHSLTDSSADAGFAGVGRYGRDRHLSPDVIMLREAQRASGDGAVLG